MERLMRNGDLRSLVYLYLILWCLPQIEYSYPIPHLWADTVITTIHNRTNEAVAFKNVGFLIMLIVCDGIGQNFMFDDWLP